MNTADCYHCGLAVPANSDFVVSIDNQPRSMCCRGCAAVATTIADSGLEHFYQFRSVKQQQPGQDRVEFTDWDIAQLQDDYIQKQSSGETSTPLFRVRLSIGNISCSACVWLIEKQLNRLAGIEQVLINGTSQRGDIIWNPEQLKLSEILATMADIGYLASPINHDSQLPELHKQTRKTLLRLGVAGLAMMQTTMVAIALYAGALQGIEQQWKNLLQLTSVMLVTPVVLYAAQPFFINSWRSLRLGHLIMDVPVAIAIALAYSASVWATYQGFVLQGAGLEQQGDVYFDSVAMFTFFLLLGRFAEQRIRHRNLLSIYSKDELLPPAASKMVANKGQTDSALYKTVPIKALKVGDLIQVNAGQTVPCDGLIKQGDSQLTEALLTGESRPQTRQVGDAVCAGTVNGANPLIIEVTAVGKGTRLANILELAERAALEKPSWVGVADRLSGWFVAAVLLIAVAVGWYWSIYDPERALWTVLSVLVVTCPCALSLATPTVLALANGLLRRQGFLINRGHVLELLAKVDQVIFDKTGTLTEGKLRLLQVTLAQGSQSENTAQVVAWAASLEQGSQHPIARALQQQHLVSVQQQQFVTGCGVSGVLTINGQKSCFALGKPDWVSERLGLQQPPVDLLTGRGIEVGLARSGDWVAGLSFDDRLRPSARGAVMQLDNLGIHVSLLSGDPSPEAGAIVQSLPLSQAQFALQPEQKLTLLKARQSEGHKILMVGDGINDIPVLQAANISVAMGESSELLKISTDAILLNNDLTLLPKAMVLANRARRLIRQNIIWAIGYNLLALPLAAMGYIPPWAAAIGMSASSLLVLLNGLRLTNTKSTVNA